MKIFKKINRIFFQEIEINSNITKMKRYRLIAEKYKNIKILKNFFLKLTRIEHNKIFFRYSCDITPEAKIGDVIFRHPLGIVIGGGAVIEDNVIIHQNVTFGALRFDSIERRGIMCRQHIKKNSIICTGAKILGDVTIGENCIVGANAVVTKDVPDGATVVGYNKVIIK